MFKFVIGLGTRSLPGAQLEQALLVHFEPDCFVIEPFVELEYKKGPLATIQGRIINYADRMKQLYDAEIYIGVSSGIAPYQGKTRRGVVWHDLMTNLQREKGLINNWRLNCGDVEYYVRRQLCPMASAEESLARASLQILEWCKQTTSS